MYDGNAPIIVLSSLYVLHICIYKNVNCILYVQQARNIIVVPYKIPPLKMLIQNSFHHHIHLYEPA